MLEAEYEEKGTKKVITCKRPAIAYMDNTVWIARTREELERIVKIATSFFKLTNINVNPQKSILLIKNASTKQTKITYKDMEIEAINHKQLCRILGCWFMMGQVPS